MDSAAIAAGVADFRSAAAFPFERAAGLSVLRATDGTPVELASLWRAPLAPGGGGAPAPATATTTLLVFGRNLLRPKTSDGLDLPALAAAHHTRVAVVLPVPLWAAQRFVREELGGRALAGALYCDPGGAAFKALGSFSLKFDTRSTFTSPHAQTTVAQATWRGLVLGLRSGTQGDPRQQGGAFVLRASTPAAAEAGAPGGGLAEECVWAHIDRHNADQVPIPVLLRAAGLPDAVYTHPRPLRIAAAADA